MKYIAQYLLILPLLANLFSSLVSMEKTEKKKDLNAQVVALEELVKTLLTDYKNLYEEHRWLKTWVFKVNNHIIEDRELFLKMRAVPQQMDNNTKKYATLIELFKMLNIQVIELQQKQNNESSSNDPLSTMKNLMLERAKLNLEEYAVSSFNTTCKAIKDEYFNPDSESSSPLSSIEEASDTVKITKLAHQDEYFNHEGLKK